MAINFPNNPAVNDTFTVSGTTFTFTGVKWETSAVVEISSDTTPSLGGALDAGTHNINNVGVITATTFSGNLTGNVTGTATNAQGLTGDPSIQVTNATVLGNLDVQGTTTTIDTAVTSVDSLAIDGLLTTLGSVGIGTTNPNRDLEVVKAGNAFIRAKNISSSVNIDILASSSAAFVGPQSNHDLGLQTNNVERLRIDSSGNVNIGVNDSSNPFTHLRFGASQYGAADIRPTDDGSHKVGLAFYVDGTQDTTINPTEALRITSGGNVELTSGSFSDSMGSLRDIPMNDQSSNASYTLVASDAGKVIHAHSTTATVVVPNSVFSAGNTVTILNGGTGNIAITQGSGFSLRNTADGSTGSRTLAQFGMATIYFSGAPVGYISGSNMT